MMRRAIFIFVYCLTVLGGVEGQADGWKMTDRFHGFRYSIPTSSATLHSTLLALAQSSSCFGWSQTSSSSTVGEYRCPKSVGLTVQKTLEDEHDAVIKVYEDTKIKLHFSRFKELDEKRITCFKDEPHKCRGAEKGGREEKEEL
ncbi:hypothetical protein TrVE_jg3970 [Triparma verrucosa]|uniref:Uncharacterized protein n=1 Tax=Triparma verrucosa TaxID=1606542 RepID=A0A9W7BDU8_9STRA|nr:hypothetical protein TrVE_jg3970 [Triparma verrucosa]